MWTTPKTKAKNPQTSEICERFHRTVQEEFYSIEDLQVDLDQWMEYYTHSGKHCYGKTPKQTWNNSLYLAKEKLLKSLSDNFSNLEPQGEAEASSGGGQLVRNSLVDRNDSGAEIAPIPKNHFRSFVPKENPNLQP